MIVYTVQMTANGWRCGNVIFQNFSHPPAPSISAASYRSGLIFWTPDRKIKIGTPENQRMSTRLFRINITGVLKIDGSD